ncbi:MAG TPA: hypothetical protein VN811_10190 [Thermoanaerobaculia bacterium]|nr:hypothetical protein [Thermoanaerobaculia bacterium]HXT51401.1 hypothetical protein [Thermoanaerobaculia bacterium]
MSASDRLGVRLRELRARAAIRRWERRQLGHARGSWDRVTRCLARARSAWTISDADAATLLAGGRLPDPAGLELEPPRRYFFVAEHDLSGLPSARPLALHTSAELLAARNVALVPFA